MTKKIIYLNLLASAASIIFLSACGGKIANSGWATIADVKPDGAILMHYSDGKSDWKRVDPDNPVRETRKAIKHINQPARFVETKSTSTLTFSDGETLLYKPMIRD